MKAILFLIVVCPIVLSIVIGCLYAEWLHRPETVWARRVLRHFEIVQNLMAVNNQESSSKYENEIRLENSLKISREINRLIPLVSIAQDVKFLGSIFGHSVPGLTDEILELPLEEIDVLPIVPEFKAKLPVAKFAPIELPYAEIVQEKPIISEKPKEPAITVPTAPIVPVIPEKTKVVAVVPAKPKDSRHNPDLDNFFAE